MEHTDPPAFRVKEEILPGERRNLCSNHDQEVRGPQHALENKTADFEGDNTGVKYPYLTLFSENREALLFSSLQCIFALVLFRRFRIALWHCKMARSTAVIPPILAPTLSKRSIVAKRTSIQARDAGVSIYPIPPVNVLPSGIPGPSAS